MSTRRGPGSIFEALLLLLAVAVGARAAYELLAPLLPTLCAIAVVAAVGWLIFRR